MKKDIELCGIGNGLVDILVHVREEEFKPLDLVRGSMTLLGAEEQKALLERFKGRDLTLASGGSVANSIIGYAQLGGKAAQLCCLGDDRYGIYYKSEFDSLGISLGDPLLVGETTGTSLIIITPDAERTMRTCLGVGGHISAHHVVEELIARSEWLFIEGYLFANPNEGQNAIRQAVAYAKKHQTRIALTCSEAFVVEGFRDAFEAVLKDADLVFANAREAEAVTGAANARDAFEALRARVSQVAVTSGAEGAYVCNAERAWHVPAYDCTPVDLTGAGDMFAGAYLYGLNHGIAPDRSARAACFLAMKVITRLGARLSQGVREFWDESMAA